MIEPPVPIKNIGTSPPEGIPLGLVKGDKTSLYLKNSDAFSPPYLRRGRPVFWNGEINV